MAITKIGLTWVPCSHMALRK